MTRILDRNRFRSHFGPEFAICLALGLGLGLASMLPTHCRAAKLSTYLTAADLARREVLDQDGQQLTRYALQHSHSALTDGSTPTYVAFPLHGGEHLPAGITTLVAGSQAGETTVGPLDFDSTIKANLNSALAASATGMAVVDTPEQDYLVEYLPRYARSRSGSTTTTAAQSTKAASSSAATELSRLLNDGQIAMTNLSTKGVAELEKLLNINTGSSKATAAKPSLNIEAQVIDSAHPLASPIPEPSTWLVFGLLLGAAGLRQRLRRRHGQRNPA